MAGVADYVVVGSGINGLVAASLLAKRGRRVTVLERNDRIGGCIRTEALTEPGFLHDVMATTFVLFVTSPAYAALRGDLAARGLAFAEASHPTGVLLPDGRHAVLSRDRAVNVAALEALAAGDGAAFDADMSAFAGNAGFVFALLGGALWSRATMKTVARELLRRGPRGLAAFFGQTMVAARAHLEATYGSETARALFAPWVLHAGLGPESAFSGEMVRVIGFALEAAGAPVVKGGADQLLIAFRRLIEDHGGTIRTGADVEAVLRDAKGRANGVRLAGGEAVAARSGVICSLAPDQLYRRLLPEAELPPEIASGLQRYRHGKGNMQMHYALSRPPRWGAPELRDVALLHLTPGLDGVSRAVNEAERGLLPAEPTICVGQPVALDPGRAPGRRLDPLDPASRGAPPCARRCGGDDRGSSGRTLDGRASGTLCRPCRSGAGRSYRGLSRNDPQARLPVARRSRSDEREPRRRRSLWRLLWYRPVFPVAPLQDLR